MCPKSQKPVQIATFYCDLLTIRQWACVEIVRHPFEHRPIEISHLAHITMRCMISYLSCNVFGMTIQSIYFVLQIALMRDLAEWIDNVILIMNYTFGIPMFFLALERCLGIQMATRFTPKLKSILLIVNLVFNPGILIAAFFVDFSFDVLWILFGLKIVIGILNACLCIFLVWKVRQIGMATSDAIVRNTAILEVFLEFLPNFASEMLYYLTSRETYLVIVSYVFYLSLPYLTQSLSALICGIIYNRALSAKQKTVVITISSAMMNNTNTVSIHRPLH
ncbi:hypothetical protein DdX_20421 [Ditylenchus destructor]|uniref:Uncharacterized protein n=1 Tax=Ditylenchus destructor TaxID=166010 RepID=A0AAD4MH77_9BILA|nr:hypothetical protein DdX_20421 [Ditylenchus destructor]